MGAVEQKALGAFYTDADIADFLTGWAVRSGHETVLDPSFGGAVFLRSAARKLARLGGDPPSQVFGVEIDKQVHVSIAAGLGQDLSLKADHLIQADFFDINPPHLQMVDVVIGNPPFIRYQRFAGGARRKALAVSAAHGVALSALSSAWAPFVIHAAAFLRPHGRLGMVVPAEIAHAGYARPVISYLLRAFRTVTLLSVTGSVCRELLTSVEPANHCLLLSDTRGEGEIF